MSKMKLDLAKLMELNPELAQKLIDSGVLVSAEQSETAKHEKEAMASLTAMSPMLKKVAEEFNDKFQPVKFSNGEKTVPVLTLTVVANDKGEPLVMKRIHFRAFDLKDFAKVYKVYFHAASLKSDSNDKREGALEDEANI